VVYVLLIFVGGSISPPELPPGGPVWSDKIMHFVAFGGMQILIFRAVRYLRPLLGPMAQNALSALLSSAMGALLELWQALLPHRSAELLDWISDSLGVLLGAALLAVVVRAPSLAQSASEAGKGPS
jgi:VanZ family protein